MRSDETIFLVGNGPSLTAEDLDKIIGADSMAMNGIAKIFPQTDWRPMHFVGFSSAARDTEFRALMQRGVDASKQAWVWDQVPRFEGDHIRLVKALHEGAVIEDASAGWWSDDIERGVSKFATCMLAAMQIAAWLGYKTMILLGVDTDYTGDRLHMVDDYYVGNIRMPKGGGPRNNRNQRIAYEVIARPNLDRLGVTVLNATRGGLLEVWPRVALEDVLVQD